MKVSILMLFILCLSSCTKIEQRMADSVISKRYGEIVLHKWKIQTFSSTYSEVTFHIPAAGDQDAKLFNGKQQIGFWGLDADNPSDLTKVRIIITSGSTGSIFGQTAYVLTANSALSLPNNDDKLKFSGDVDLVYNFVSGSGLEAVYANSQANGQFVATAYPNRITW